MGFFGILVGFLWEFCGIFMGFFGILPVFPLFFLFLLLIYGWFSPFRSFFGLFLFENLPFSLFWLFMLVPFMYIVFFLRDFSCSFYQFPSVLRCLRGNVVYKHKSPRSIHPFGGEKQTCTFSIRPSKTPVRLTLCFEENNININEQE